MKLQGPEMMFWVDLIMFTVDIGLGNTGSNLGYEKVYEDKTFLH